MVQLDIDLRYKKLSRYKQKNVYGVYRTNAVVIIFRTLGHNTQEVETRKI